MKGLMVCLSIIACMILSEGSADARTIKTVDGSGNMLGYPAAVMGQDGLPVVAYCDSTNGYLRVAKCGDSVCAAGTSLVTVDGSGDVGGYVSMVLGTDGFPVISYYDLTNSSLKVVKCADASCTTSAAVTVDSSEGFEVGYYNSIALGADGYPVIAYSDIASGLTSGNLKVAKCGDSSCSAASISSVDGSGDVGGYISLAIGGDGFPVISYQLSPLAEATSSMYLAKCGDASCSSGTTLSEIESGSSNGFFSSIAMAGDGNPMISYVDFSVSPVTGYLKAAFCGDASCSAISGISLIGEGGFVESTSVALGANGLPVISFIDYPDNWTDGYLDIAQCGDATCSSDIRIATLDSSGQAGDYTSVVSGGDGFLVAYDGGANGFVKMAYVNQKSQVGTFRSGKWYIDADGSGTWNSAADTVYTFGISGDVPVTGDWNGDGLTEIGVVRGNKWYMDMNGDGAWNTGDAVWTFGLSSDKPVTGDWNGSGSTKIGVFRDGKWYLDVTGDGLYGAGDASYTFGKTGDKPVTGDWTGSGSTNIGIVRETAAGDKWYLDGDGNGIYGGGDLIYTFGITGDSPVSGDWNGDGGCEVGVRRGTKWFLDLSGDGAWSPGDSAFSFGGTDLTVTGKW